MTTRPTTDPTFATGANAKLNEPDGFRAGGYPFKKIWAANEANWHFNTIGEWLRWLEGSAGRFEGTRELYDALEDGDTAYIDTAHEQGAELFDSSLFETIDIALTTGGGTVDHVFSDGRFVWVFDQAGDVSQFNADNVADQAEINTFSPGIRVQFCRGNTRYLAYYEDGTATVYVTDYATLSTAIVGVPGAVRDLCFARDDKIWVAHDSGGGGENASRIDAPTATIDGTLATGVNSVGVDVSPLDNRVFISNDSPAAAIQIGTSDQLAGGSTDAVADLSGTSYNGSSVNRNIGWSRGRLIVAEGVSTGNIIIVDRFGNIIEQGKKVASSFGTVQTIATSFGYHLCGLGPGGNKNLVDPITLAPREGIGFSTKYWSDDGYYIYLPGGGAQVSRLKIPYASQLWKRWDNTADDRPVLDLFISPIQR